ncbi:hypothetical protein BD626DRAFT_494613 [Schizophyllum amplum]|uniref:Ubiquitin-like domain-containing protein n=1 Tax=Schizophyllum amplum TaxID=97359 RepID=A0A550CFF2_9AGAR|nr:hypothetical protein BD626DRAFT_494613 [Auriculariopsis ampla]
MADAERAFLTNLLHTVGAQPVNYPDDYRQPPENTLRKVPVLPLPVPPPPARAAPAASSSANVTLTFKSLKPAATYSLSVSPADSIATVKTALAGQSGAPPADAQRLLLRGKALADAKLLKEYDVKDGDTLTLAIRPGVQWDPNAPSPSSPDASMEVPKLTVQQPRPQKPATETLALSAGDTKRKGHGRTPSIVLSPSPTNEDAAPAEIDLTLDTSENTFKEPPSAFQTTLATPEFWDRLYSFLRTEFAADTDSQRAFEDFLAASKSSLSASEIARIRDHVGVVGMAGT